MKGCERGRGDLIDETANRKREKGGGAEKARINLKKKGNAAIHQTEREARS